MTAARTFIASQNGHSYTTASSHTRGQTAEISAARDHKPTAKFVASVDSSTKSGQEQRRGHGRGGISADSLGSPLGGPPHERVLSEEVRATSLAARDRAPTLPTPAQAIAGLRKWLGTITEVDGDSFTAELEPMDHNGTTVYADFNTDLLDASNDSSDMISPGDVFYLTVRTTRMGGRRTTQTAALRLRRLGRWSADEVQEIKETARERAERVKKLVD